MKYNKICLHLALMTILWASVIHAQDNTELAKKLANPVAPMITLPLQFNYDRGYLGTNGNESNQWVLNVQPVIPFSLNDEWNLISRTVVPLVRTDNIPFGSGVQSAMGDIVQTLFFSPKYPTESGWVLGAGPVFLLPSGSKFSTKSWGTGAAFVALKQENKITYGMHLNHVKSFAGSTNVSSTLIQPFFTYTTNNAVSYALASDTTYNWESPSSERLTVPLIATVSKVFTIGTQNISLGAGLKYYIESPSNGPQGLGARFFMTFMFPKK
jgi:hypothetical protein